jgi:23S rRNA (guanosine2251-2'-O)-methyltransferase
VPVARVTNLARALDDLKDQGFWVVGTAGEAAEDLYAAALPTPAVLVLGGEHGGLRPNVRKRCDRVVAVPLAGAVAALNVAVACGVAAYELRRRHAAGEPH